jgi:hypothetical protein
VVETVPEVIETVTGTVDDVVDDVSGVVSGLVGGFFGRGARSASDTSATVVATNDAEAADEVAGTVDLGDSSDSADGLATDVGDVVDSIVLASTDAVADFGGDDGFLDTLLSGDGVEALLNSAPDEIFEGLLGGEDTFGLDVVPGVSDDDLSAGLSGGASLTGSLADQSLLDLSDQTETADVDDEVDGLLNDILAGGVDDILGQASEFTSLLGGDADSGDDASISGEPIADLFEDSVVEGALGVLFSSDASSDGGLLAGLGDGFSSDEPT